jgi:NADH dehydrogenase (ubiquinone) 1 beta subcomplex subunit 9
LNGIKDSARIPRLIREAEERLAAQTHPDPYIKPFMPGGSLFMRNPAIPLEALYPDGIPDHYSK